MVVDQRTNAPIGRRQLWRDLTHWLEADRSGVIALSGRPGSGRSFLLARLAEYAASRGYTVVGGEDPFPVEPTTRVGDFVRVVASALTEHQEWESSAQPELDHQAFFDLLTARAPVMIGIDGFQPGATFSAWFSDQVLPVLRRSGRPILTVLLVAADQAQPVRLGFADVCHQLGPLDLVEIRDHLRDVSVNLEPPLEAAELEAYAGACQRDPGLLSAMEIVLSDDALASPADD